MKHNEMLIYTDRDQISTFQIWSFSKSSLTPNLQRSKVPKDTCTVVFEQRVTAVPQYGEIRISLQYGEF